MARLKTLHDHRFPFVDLKNTNPVAAAGATRINNEFGATVIFGRTRHLNGDKYTVEATLPDGRKKWAIDPDLSQAIERLIAELRYGPYYKEKK